MLHPIEFWISTGCVVDLADSKFSYGNYSITEQKSLTFRDLAKRKGRLFCVCTPDFFASLNTFLYFCKDSIRN